MEHPTIEQEIERKALETLEQAVHGLQTRKYTIAEARGMLNALWGSMAGLVCKETMELISTAHKQVNEAFLLKAPPDQCSAFVSPQHTVVLERFGVGVKLKTFRAGASVGVKTYVAPGAELHPEKWAADKFKELAAALTGKGMTCA